MIWSLLASVTKRPIATMVSVAPNFWRQTCSVEIYAPPRTPNPQKLVVELETRWLCNELYTTFESSYAVQG